MKVKIVTLEYMSAWQVLDRGDSMNFNSSEWVFKCNLYPDALIKNFKRLYFAHDDQKLDGILFFKSYEPVVKWETVHLIIVLEIALGLKSKQADFISAFLHAYFPNGNKFYVDMPTGFEQFSTNGQTKCLRLKRTLYRLRQISCAFWQYLTKKLELS